MFFTMRTPLSGLIPFATLLTAWCFSTAAGPVLAQAGAITGTPIPEGRYEEHKGSPYLFAEDVMGVVTVSGGLQSAPTAMNYNGFTEQWEIAGEGDTRVALDERNYPRVTVFDGADTLTFVRGLRPGHAEKYVLKVYSGPEAALYKAFIASEGKSTVQNVGKTETFLRFSPNPLYFLSLGGGPPELVQLRRKPFLKALPGAANSGDLARVWKRADGDDEARAAAVLAAYAPE